MTSSEPKAPVHPTQRIFKVHSITTDREFWNALVDREFYQLWAKWFCMIFRTDVTEEQGLAIYASLCAKGFTNKQFHFACERIESTCRNWPHLKDFIASAKDEND